jgi:type III pantothenate kinase
MTALLLDVGNTRLKWGVLEDGDIRRTGHIAQDKIREKGLAALTTRLPRRVDAVWISNVAGNSVATRLAGVVGMHCNCDAHFARSERRGWGVTNAYRQPRRLGVDRWVAMVGAWDEVKSSCLVVDAGTALTLDALDSKGVHLGGQIIPGVETMMNSLAAATSDIPSVKVDTRQPADDLKLFGRNTAAAVREGAQNALVGAIDRAVRILRSNGYRPKIVLTGGGAARILDVLGTVPLHRPHLVLHGLAHMLEHPE